AGTVAGLDATSGSVDLATRHAGCPETGEPAAFYAALRDAGIEHGPSFRTIEQLKSGPAGSLGLVRAPHGHDDFVVHPGMLDAAFQVLGHALARHAHQDEVSLPVG